MDSNRVPIDGYEVNGVERDGTEPDEVEPDGFELSRFDPYGCEPEAMSSTCVDDILSIRPRIDLIFETLFFLALLDVPYQL